MGRKSSSSTVCRAAGVQVLMKAIRLAAIASIYAGGLVPAFSMSVQAAETFGNTGVQFDTDTIVEFEFVESHGAYQSTFGVINLDTREKTPLLVEVKPSDNPQDVLRPSSVETRGVAGERDFLGTPGNTVPQPLAEFKFKANTKYAFYLESTYNGRPVGIIYSTDVLNSNGKPLPRIQGDLSALGNGGTVIGWDDTGSVLVRVNQEDRDYNDFIVRAGGHIACPYDRNVSTQPLSKGLTKVVASSCQSPVKIQ
jgi:hypothetical protein